MNQSLTNRIYWVSTGFLSVLMLLDGSQFVIHSQSFLEDIRRLGYPSIFSRWWASPNSRVPPSFYTKAFHG